MTVPRAHNLVNLTNLKIELLTKSGLTKFFNIVSLLRAQRPSNTRTPPPRLKLRPSRAERMVHPPADHRCTDPPPPPPVPAAGEDGAAGAAAPQLPLRPPVLRAAALAARALRGLGHSFPYHHRARSSVLLFANRAVCKRLFANSHMLVSSPRVGK